MRTDDDDQRNPAISEPTRPPRRSADKLLHDLTTGDLPPLKRVETTGHVLTIEDMRVIEQLIGLSPTLQVHLARALAGEATADEWQVISGKFAEAASLTAQIAVNMREDKSTQKGETAGQAPDGECT